MGEQQIYQKTKIYKKTTHTPKYQQHVYKKNNKYTRNEKKQNTKNKNIQTILKKNMHKHS